LNEISIISPLRPFVLSTKTTTSSNNNNNNNNRKFPKQTKPIFLINSLSFSLSLSLTLVVALQIADIKYTEKVDAFVGAPNGISVRFINPLTTWSRSKAGTHLFNFVNGFSSAAAAADDDSIANGHWTVQLMDFQVVGLANSITLIDRNIPV